MPDDDGALNGGRVDAAAICGEGDLRDGVGPFEDVKLVELTPVDVGDIGGRGGRCDNVDDTCNQPNPLGN